MSGISWYGQRSTRGNVRAALEKCCCRAATGFGANLHSYKKVQQPLAEALGDGALVTSHDMPGFGLTERWVSLKKGLLHV